ncbi:hypothetical protein KP509_37G033000 [Ceratopteris richardii]|uniref:Protein kinase domain-containing protein n=1 Tax=Ceratopteris richardii TaxID=49495 RepID=A0A8T2Q835_CERRI|nr:hypothetical protein KP509_37G033000 [Ceratopteris richardii]
MSPSEQHTYAAIFPARPWKRGPRLGSGTFGTVFLALSLDDDLVIVVKSAPLSSSVSHISSLQDELRILRRLDSPRIVRCLGADVSPHDQGLWFNLFLEYMPGGSVQDFMRRSGGKLEENVAAGCTRAVLEGLCYLHKEGIVHSDVKSSNILLGANGEIKLADFGAAREFSFRETSADCKIAGTPLWMAPEVLQGVDQGPPSDIWSLGCTLIEMLHGRLPWGDPSCGTSFKDLEPLLVRIACSDDALPPVGESLSAEARDFLSKCLCRDPMDRWTSEQLLQHPFVTRKECSYSSYASKASPRSALDFYSDMDTYSNSSGSLKPLMSSIYTTDFHSPARREEKKHVHEDFSRDRSKVWYIVRHGDGRAELEEKPFFTTRNELVVTGGNEVSFDSASFLTKRVSIRMSER